MSGSSAARGEAVEGPARKVVSGGDGKCASARRRRRRLLELSRVGRGDGGSAKRVRPGPGPEGSSSSPDPPSPGPWPACALSHGAVSVIGRRREMEDAFAVAPAFLRPADGGGDQGQDFFAVYDGHGGARVAEACRDRMHVVLAEEVGLRRRVGSDDVRWEDAMAASFARVDGEVTGGSAPQPKPQQAADDGADADPPYRTIGSTAVVAVVGPRSIVVANCGDSRAVLCRGGAAVPLSTDHKPDRPDEMQRVEAAGGSLINWNGYRVLGVLSTSRSIGDYYLKPYVSAVPEVTVVERTEQDEFLILASDGLWDVVSNEMACKIARSCLSGRAASMFPESVAGRTAADAAALLTELAMSRGSKDNVSAVVVELRRRPMKSAGAA